MILILSLFRRWLALSLCLVLIGTVPAFAQDIEIPLMPLVDCVVDLGNNVYTAFFGYTNTVGKAVEVPLGADNFLAPAPQDPDQQPPTRFRPKGSLTYPLAAFGIEFDGSDLTWTLGGQTAIANKNSPACPLTTTTVAVDPHQTYQTIQGWGGAFVHDNSKSLVSGSQDEVSRYNLEHFQVTHFRVGMPLNYWEPENDDVNPQHYEWSNFALTDKTERVFEFMQMVERADVQIIASIWNVPKWMVVNPDQPDKFSLNPDLYDEVIESMTAWLVYARDQYGVEVDYVSFNEPNLGVTVAMTAQQYAEFVQRGGARFVEEGLPTRWVFAEANNMGATPTYSRLVWEDEAARPYLGPFVFHSWDADLSDRGVQQIRTWATENQLETWVTESGYDPALWERPEEFQTWENALLLARLYSRLYKLSGASVLFYWQMMDDYALVSRDGKQPFPAFQILKQFQMQFPVGAVIVDTSPNTDTLYSVAAQAESHFVLHLTNTAQIPEQVEISGLPSGTYTYISSRPGVLLDPVGRLTVTEGIPVQLVLPRRSVAVLTTKP